MANQTSYVLPVAAAMGYSAVTGAAPNLRGEPVSPRPRTTVKPIRVRTRDPETGLVVSRVVAYCFDCDCGKRGRSWRSWAEAAAERRYHAGSHDTGQT